MARLSVFVQSGGTLGDANANQTLDKIWKGFYELQDMCGIGFFPSTDSVRSNIRIWFKNNAEMKAASGTTGTPLGLGWYVNNRNGKKGQIYLNSERFFYAKAVDRYIIQGLVMHEFLHTQGFAHSWDTTAVMHPDLTTPYPNAAEGLAVQRKWGRPTRNFRVQSIVRTWEPMKAQFLAAQAGWARIKSVIPEIQAERDLVKKQQMLADREQLIVTTMAHRAEGLRLQKERKALQAAWKSVPMATS